MTAETRDPALPVDLRERVLSAALRARGAGRAEPAAPEISPAEAFRRAADAFHGTLRLLRDDQWREPTLRGLDVQGLVGHLTGVEEDVQRCLAGDPAVAAAGRTIALVRACGDPRAKVAVHGMRLPLDLLLVIRAFELWVHENDIRAAAALPPSAPDASTLTLMTSAAVRLLPSVAARTGLDEPTSVHLVLTGPGGGTWDITLGRASRTPAAVAIVTDALGFCRLAANRATPASLDSHVTGDPDRAAAVLAAATALALD